MSDSIAQIGATIGKNMLLIDDLFVHDETMSMCLIEKMKKENLLSSSASKRINLISNIK